MRALTFSSEEPQCRSRNRVVALLFHNQMLMVGKADVHHMSSGQNFPSNSFSYSCLSRRVMCYAFAKAKHAVAKDLRKIARTFHWRKCAKAPESWQKLSKSVPSTKACKCVFAQNSGPECQNASRESVAKGTCERRTH